MPEPSDSPRLERAIHDLQTSVSANTIAQQELSSTLKELRSEIAQTYVRQDVLQPMLAGVKKEIEDVRDDIKSHGDWITWGNRLVLTLFIAAVFAVVLMLGGGR